MRTYSVTFEKWDEETLETGWLLKNVDGLRYCLEEVLETDHNSLSIEHVGLYGKTITVYHSPGLYDGIIENRSIHFKCEREALRVYRLWEKL